MDRINRNLLLERDMLLFDPWDALQTGSKISGGFEADKTTCFRKASATGITISVYGTFGISDLTGHKIIEDMQVFLGDSDITSDLPESLLQELEESAIEEAA